MATYSKRVLSGSTDGRPIKIAATATPGTTIHTATATSGEIDELWLWAVNTYTVTHKLTVEWGGTTAPDDLIEVGIPAGSGLVLVVPGLPVRNGVIVRAFAAAANVVNVVGYANRIAP